MRKNIIISIIYLCFFSFAYASESYEKEYINKPVNNNTQYTGRVKITQGNKQYHNIWEIKSNSVKCKNQTTIIKCTEKRKYIPILKTLRKMIIHNTLYILIANFLQAEKLMVNGSI
ncbi:hypothetical protein JO41_02605 [Treponema sp. OMZ 838]|nr:hypothetical protein JO41_02605 [Treponema sp. OMZ 838]